jgi:hypothetical protein
MKNIIDKFFLMRYGFVQVAFNPRVIGRNRTRKTLRIFCAQQKERLSGVGVIENLARGNIPAVSYHG